MDFVRALCGDDVLVEPNYASALAGEGGRGALAPIIEKAKASSFCRPTIDLLPTSVLIRRRCATKPWAHWPSRLVAVRGKSFAFSNTDLMVRGRRATMPAWSALSSLKCSSLSSLWLFMRSAFAGIRHTSRQRLYRCWLRLQSIGKSLGVPVIIRYSVSDRMCVLEACFCERLCGAVADDDLLVRLCH